MFFYECEISTHSLALMLSLASEMREKDTVHFILGNYSFGNETSHRMTVMEKFRQEVQWLVVNAQSVE